MLIIEDNYSSQTENESNRANSPDVLKQLDSDITILETNEETRSKTYTRSQLQLRRSESGS